MESSNASALREGADIPTWPGSRNLAAVSTAPTSAAEDVGGSPDRARLRDRLETTTFAGITTRYAFTAARHAGFDMVDLVYLRWSIGARPGFALVPEAAPTEER